MIFTASVWALPTIRQLWRMISISFFCFVLYHYKFKLKQTPTRWSSGLWKILFIVNPIPIFYIPDGTACLPCNLPEDIGPSYWRMSNCVSICWSVSRITPTMMRSDVPPKKVEKFWDIPEINWINPGRIPTNASNTNPGNVDPIHDGTDIICSWLAWFYRGWNRCFFSVHQPSVLDWI